MADVEAMFHQVRVAPNDRDTLRFLWWQDGDITKPIVTYRMTSHLFGGVWSPSCANYTLKRTAEDCKDEFNQEVVETVKNNFYVDDCLNASMMTKLVCLWLATW